MKKIILYLLWIFTIINLFIFIGLILTLKTPNMYEIRKIGLYKEQLKVLK